MRAPRPTSSACRSPRRAPTRHRIDWAAYDAAAAEPSSAPRVFDDWDLAELARYIDWTPFFQTWELKGRYPKILEDEEQGAAARAALRRRAGDARARSSTRAGSRRGPSSASGRPTPSATTSALFTDESRSAGARHLLHPAPAAAPSATASRTSRSPISSRRSAAASPTMSAASSSPPASRRWRSPSASSAPTTTIPRSWSRRSPTASPKPSPSACTSGCAREFWGYAPDESLRARGADRRALSRHPPGARLSGPARPHREGDAVPPARRRAQRPASA